MQKIFIGVAVFVFLTACATKDEPKVCGPYSGNGTYCKDAVVTGVDSSSSWFHEPDPFDAFLLGLEVFFKSKYPDVFPKQPGIDD